jgi:hypothetical protein
VRACLEAGLYFHIFFSSAALHAFAVHFTFTIVSTVRKTE